MARIKTDNTKQYQADIRKINEVRKSAGFKPLPIRNTKWYENVIKFSEKRYSNSEYATKVIGLSISPYQATKLQTDKAYVSRLNGIVKKESFYDTSMDKAIRSNRNTDIYGSDVINRLADRDDALGIEAFKAGKRSWQEYLKKTNLKSI